MGRRLFPFLPEDLVVPASRWDCHPFQFENAKPSFSVVCVIWDVQMDIWTTWKKLCLQLEHKESKQRIHVLVPFAPRCRMPELLTGVACCPESTRSPLRESRCLFYMLSLQTLQATAPGFPSGVLNISGDD